MSRHARNEETKGNPVLVIVAIFIFALGAGAIYLVLSGRASEFLTNGSSQSQPASSEAVSTKQASDMCLDDYSWADLSSISAEIAAADSDETGLVIAERYHLANADGTLTDDVKDVTLADGTVVQFQIAGFRHDDKADGSGKAGITFASVNAVGSHAMNANGTNDGGWEESDMRAWLNGDFLDELPEDLSGSITSVSKATNNSGSAASSSSVTTTADRLWLFSATEVCGDIDWFSHEYGSKYGFWDDVANSEGTQYQVFAEKGVSSRSDSQGALEKTLGFNKTSWSYRSAFNFVYEFLSQRYFYGVMDSGYPHAFYSPDTVQGVVVGFCI